MKFTALIAIAAAADWDGKDEKGVAANQKNIALSGDQWKNAQIVDIGSDIYKDTKSYQGCVDACKTVFGDKKGAWAC